MKTKKERKEKAEDYGGRERTHSAISHHHALGRLRLHVYRNIDRAGSSQINLSFSTRIIYAQCSSVQSRGEITAVLFRFRDVQLPDRGVRRFFKGDMGDFP